MFLSRDAYCVPPIPGGCGDNNYHALDKATSCVTAIGRYTVTVVLGGLMLPYNRGHRI